MHAVTSSNCIWTRFTLLLVVIPLTYMYCVVNLIKYDRTLSKHCYLDTVLGHYSAVLHVTSLSQYWANKQYLQGLYSPSQRLHVNVNLLMLVNKRSRDSYLLKMVTLVYILNIVI